MDGEDWTLERLVPAYDKREYHAVTIAAAPPVVWAALHDLTVAELPLTRRLMTVHSGGRARLSGRALDALPSRPVATVHGREVVLGGVAQYARLRPRQGPAPADPAGFARFSRPGWSKVAMNFRLTPDGARTRLSTGWWLTHASWARSAFTGRTLWGADCYIPTTSIGGRISSGS